MNPNWMRELAESLDEPSPELEARLRAAYRARTRAAKQRRWLWAVAATFALGIGLGAWLSTSRPPEPVSTAKPNGDFLLLDYGRPTPGLTSGRLVRVTLPPNAPAWFGLPVDPSARQGIEAEVLLGDDGVAQAVRFVE